jgi:glycosyltransferase involved in cell wall biosynthesis
MKICVIGTVGVPASYGGFETLVDRLIDSSSAEFYVYCSAKHYPDGVPEYKGAKLIYIPLNANGVASIFYDIFSMIHALFNGHKNFLVLGVSGAVFFPIVRLFPDIRLVTNIDGIEWQRDKWKGLAKIFLSFSEYFAVKFSTTVVSDNSAITEYAFKRYKRMCETIAYGGDHAVRAEMLGVVSGENKFHIDHYYALSICRIEPENNVHVILEAFSITGLHLVFIGNWESSDYGRSLYRRYKDNKNIVLLKPIYCLDVLHGYRVSCSVYIHGHSAGGTNPSLVEMMHFAKPIVAYDCSFNKATMEDKGNYFSCVDGLIKLLGKNTVLDDGVVLREIAQRRYTWDIVRTKYVELFKT